MSQGPFGFDDGPPVLGTLIVIELVMVAFWAVGTGLGRLAGWLVVTLG